MRKQLSAIYDQRLESSFVAKLQRTAYAKAAVMLLIIMMALSTMATARAQETDTSDEVERLTNEKAILQLKKEKAELEKALLEAKFPKSTTKPLEGKTTVDEGVVIESQMMSYHSLVESAKGISEEIKTAFPNMEAVAIFNERDVKLMLSYSAFNNQLKLMKCRYDKFLPKLPASETVKTPEGSRGLLFESLATPTHAINAATSILGSFIDLVGLFRTDTEINGHSFNVDESALVAETYRELRKFSNMKAVFYYPGVFPPNIDLNKNSRLLGQVETLYELRARAAAFTKSFEDNEKKVGKLEGENLKLEGEITENEQEIKKIKDHIDTLDPRRQRRRIEELKQQISKLEEANVNTRQKIEKNKKEIAALKEVNAKDENRVLQLRALNAHFDKMVNDLIKPDDAAGINALTAYIKAENLADVMKLNDTSCDNVCDDKCGKKQVPETYWLQLKVVKAGGNNKTRRNFFDVFTGNKLTHSGGSIVEYMVYDTTGAVRLHDVRTNYLDYRSAKKIRDQRNN